ncbi:MAG: FecR domain-containing protein [Deltaproteobacteria bacterium]
MGHARGKIKGRPALILFFFVFSFLGSICHAASGSIDAISGIAYHKPKDGLKWGVLKSGDAISVGDRIKTGADGRVTVRLKDSTRLMIGNDTELEITRHYVEKDKRGALYSLTGGRLRAVVMKFSGASDIKVRTRSGVMGIKGTDFIVMNHNDANIVFGMEDAVNVAGLDTASVELGQGLMTENTRGNAPIEPVRVEPQTPLEEALNELKAVTDAHAPVEWERAGRLPSIMARWNMNYGRYLADSLSYPAALDVFQIAIDLTDEPKVKAEAHLERGGLFSVNLMRPEDALSEFNEVMDNFREEPFLENAVYYAGAVNMGLGKKDEAALLFRRYLQEYPNGSKAETVKTFIKSLER